MQAALRARTMGAVAPAVAAALPVVFAAATRLTSSLEVKPSCCPSTSYCSVPAPGSTAGESGNSLESDLRAKWRARAAEQAALGCQRAATAAAAGRRLAGAQHFAVLGTPATLGGAMRLTDKAVVVTEARRPFEVVYVNDKWTDLCGWEYEEAVGAMGLRFLQGRGTSAMTLNQIEAAVENGDVLRTHLLNYRKDGTPFFNKLQVSPLFDDHGRVSHVLGILEAAT